MKKKDPQATGAFTRPAGPQQAAGGMRVLVLKSRFNADICDGLAEGAFEFLNEAGADVTVHESPGAFELPLLAQEAAKTKRFEAVIALGAVLKGETDHYEHISRETARGLMEASLATGVPVAFGVLTVAEPEHAIVRSRPGPGNKGREAAAAAVETALLLRRLRAAGRR